MSGRKSLVKKIKKIKKKGLKKKERVPICQEKKKTSFGEKNKKYEKKRLKEERKSTNLSRKEKNFLCKSD